MSTYENIKNQFVKVLFALLALFVLNIACGEDDSAPDPDPVKPAPNLTYTKQTVTYDELSTIVGSADKKAGANLILKGVTGQKDGYTIQTIRLVKSDPANIASVRTEGGSFVIRLKGIASVTFDLTLKHATKAKVTIKNCEIVIGKGTAADDLTFDKLAKPYIKDGIFTTAEILAKVQGSKKGGYTLKEIKNISPVAIAVVDGKTIKMKKIGNFKADLVLEHPNKADATITGAQFEITKATAASLTFNKLTEVYVRGGTFTTDEILAKVDGTKDGYTLKSISLLSPVGIATIKGTAPNLRLNFEVNKTGSFTATLVLAHPTKADATITRAQFEITKASAASLGFTKLIKVYSSGGKFTKAQIEANVTPSDSGYQLNKIENISDANVASISGTSINMTKAGPFTAKLTLTHPTKADAIITTAQFEITKANATNLGFTKLTKVYSSGGKITKAQIEANVTPSDSGYQLRKIENISDTSVASISGTSINMTKAGSFTAKLTLTHPSKTDATITTAQFEITKASTASLGFTKLIKVYSRGGAFTKAQIEANVTPSGSGYQLNKIENISDTNVASVSGTSIKMTKAGSFTAKLTLTHPTKADGIITAAQFEITKATASLSFARRAMRVDFGASVSNNLTRTPAGGLLSYISSNRNVATVDSRGTVTIKGIGTTTITATQTATNTHKLATAQYTLTVNKRAGATDFNFSELSEVYSRGGSFSENEILNNVTGTKTGYTLKSIGTLTPGGIATVSSDGKNLKFTKAGRFTAKLVLEHPTKADVTIDAAKFEITKIPVRLFFTRATVNITLGASVTNPLRGATGAISYRSSRPAVATIDGAGKVSLVSAGETTITATQAATDTHKGDSASYTLTVNAKTLPIAGDPTGKSGEWGKALAPNYRVPATIANPTGGAAINASYAYAIKSAGASTGFASADWGKATHFDTATGEIKAGATKGAGNITVTITRKAISGKYKVATKDVVLTLTKPNSPDIVHTSTPALQSEWGKAYAPDYKLPTSITINGQTLNVTYSYAIKSATGGTGGVGFNKITGAFNNATTGAGTVTVTITRQAIANKIDAKTKDVVVAFKDGIISGNARSGLSGKWGKGTITPNYDLKGTGYNFTFAVQSAVVVAPTGLQKTTAGISGGNALGSVINSNNGKVDTSKLVKSGYLLIKITRSKTGEATKHDYVNFEVKKQEKADLSSAKTSATAVKWRKSAVRPTYTTRTELGLGAVTYSLQAGSTAGTIAGSAGDIIVASDGAISKTVRQGVVKVRASYAESEKYKALYDDFDVTITRRDAPTGLAVSATAQEWGTTIAPTVTIPTVDGVVAYLQSRDSNNEVTYTMRQVSKLGTVDVGGSINANTGAITGTESGGKLEITAAFKQNVRYKASTAKVQVDVKRKASTVTLNVGGFFPTASASWNKATTKLMPRPDQAGSVLSFALQPALTPATITTDTEGIPTADKAIASDYEFNTNSDFTGTTPTTVKNTHFIRSKAGGRKNKGVRLIFNISASADGKYKAKTVYGYMRTQQPDADLAIDGMPSGTRGEWGNALTPAYNVPATIADPDGGSPLTPTYTYTVKSADASTGFASADWGKATHFTDKGAIKAGVIKGAGTVTVTITRAAISGKYKAATKDVVLTFTKPTSPDIAHTTAPTLESEWGKAYTPDYKLPTSVTVNGQTLNVTYSYAVKAVTGSTGIITGEVAPKFTTTTGAFSNATTGAGTVTVTITRKAVANKIDAKTKDVVVTFKIRSLPIGGTPSGTSGEWGNALTPTYNVPTTIAAPNGGSPSTPTYAYAIKAADASTGFASADWGKATHFNAATGEIKAGVIKSLGTVTVTITRAAISDKYKAATKDVKLTFTKATYTMGDALSGISSEWGKAVTPDYKLPNNGGNITVNGQTFTPSYTYEISAVTGDTGYSSRPSFSTLKSRFNNKTGEITARTIGTGTITVKVTRDAIANKLDEASKTLTVTFTKPASPAIVHTAAPALQNEWGKAYSPDYKLPTNITVNGQRLNVTYSYAVKAAEASTGISVGETVKFDTATGSFTSATTGAGTVTVTITRAAIANKIDAQTKDVVITFRDELISGASRSGLLGKWGKAAVTPNYDLVKTGGYTDANFKFEVASASTSAPAGKQKTTAGISGSNALGSVIDGNTGEVNTDKLVKSGYLLIKVTRSKTGEATKYDHVNFEVKKQERSDLASPVTSATAIEWSDAAVSPTYTTRTESGLGAVTYSLRAGSTAGKIKQGGAGNIAVDSDGKISKTVCKGVVEVRATYPANEKYTKIEDDFKVTIEAKESPITINTAVASAAWNAATTPLLPKHDETALSIKSFVKNVADWKDLINFSLFDTESHRATLNVDFEVFKDDGTVVSDVNRERRAIRGEMKDGKNPKIRSKSGATPNKSVTFEFEFRETSDGKYKGKVIYAYARTQ